MEDHRPRWWPLGAGLVVALVVAWAFVTAWGGIVGSSRVTLITLLVVGAAALGLIAWSIRVGPPPPRSPILVWIARGGLVIGAVVLVGMLVFLRPLSADRIAIDALVDGGGVVVEISGSSIRMSNEAEPRPVGLAFYPGARVDPRAYANVLRPVAEAGFEVVIFKQPFNLAVLAPNAADAVIGDPTDTIDRWVVAGHSLGGAMASRYAEREREELVGLLLHAAYPVTDMSARTELAVMSIFGTEDGLAEPGDIAERMSDLPPATEYIAIDGGIHSFFGDYGRQRGDGTPLIAREDAQRQIAEASIRLLESLDGP